MVLLFIELYEILNKSSTVFILLCCIINQIYYFNNLQWYIDRDPCFYDIPILEKDRGCFMRSGDMH